MGKRKSPCPSFVRAWWKGLAADILRRCARWKPQDDQWIVSQYVEIGSWCCLCLSTVPVVCTERQSLGVCLVMPPSQRADHFYRSRLDTLLKDLWHRYHLATAWILYISLVTAALRFSLRFCRSGDSEHQGHWWNLSCCEFLAIECLACRKGFIPFLLVLI